MQHFDRLETRAPEAREAALMAALPAHIAHAKANAPGFARILADVDTAAVSSRAALAKLPVTRKSELAELQKAMPPLGGLNATPVAKLAKLFVSPGPIYEPEGTGEDWWRCARALPKALNANRLLRGRDLCFGTEPIAGNTVLVQRLAGGLDPRLRPDRNLPFQIWFGWCVDWPTATGALRRGPNLGGGG